jgi:hypothetical protein
LFVPRVERRAEEAGLPLSISPGACTLLRDQLVEVITCVRSQASLVEQVAWVGDSPFTEAEDGTRKEP